MNYYYELPLQNKLYNYVSSCHFLEAYNLLTKSFFNINTDINVAPLQNKLYKYVSSCHFVQAYLFTYLSRNH